MAEEIFFHEDHYDGISVDVSDQTIDLTSFAEKLKGAIVEWTKRGKRGLWVTVPISSSVLIPQLIELGFDFHHALPGSACLTKWLASDVPNHLPGYANHFVGVAGFVVNSNNEVLAIQEKVHVKNKISMWKLPGGLAEPGEELKDTASREVFEETGVHSEFICLLGFRHMHGYRHGCSDMYFVCLMRPLTLELKPCPQEIAACQWMDIDDYESSGLNDINRYFVKLYRDYQSTGIAVSAKEVLSYNKKSMNNVYSGSVISMQQCLRDNMHQSDKGGSVPSS